MEGKRVHWIWSRMLRTIILKNGSKIAHFHLKWTTAWHHGVRDTHLQSFDMENCDEEQPSVETPT